MTFTCKICGSVAAHTKYVVQERMFGLGDEFVYFQCGECGCLQLAGNPPDLSRYYPTNYYSFKTKRVKQTGVRHRIAANLDRGLALGYKNWLSKFAGGFMRPRPEVSCLIKTPLNLDSRILDAGCGSGQLLSILHRAGFRHLLGADPFLEADYEIAPGVQVRKKSLEELKGEFNLIMFHHVFEHVPNGEKTLADAKRLLSTQGRILLRLPTPDSLAWEQYREKWVQLDAPRHLFLYSRRSIEILAERLGLRIEHWWCDSTEFQFLGSELYKKGIPLHGAKFKKQFSRQEIAESREKAKLVNERGQGDQVVVVLARN